jgi:hypothetical protein
LAVSSPFPAEVDILETGAQVDNDVFVVLHFYAGLASCLIDGAPPPIEPADAVLVAGIIEAAKRSDSAKTVVTL